MDIQAFNGQSQGIKEYVPDPVRTAKVVETIQKARINLLISQAFWGTLATRLKLVDASAWCDSFAVDGGHFYYNVEFFEKMDREEIKFCLGHSILHLAYDHFMRRDSRDEERWDRATDYVVNRDLEHEKLGKMPEGALFDQQFKEMTAEEVYKELPQECPDGGGSIDMHMSPGSGGEGDGDQQTDANGNASSSSMPGISESDWKQMRDEFKNAMIQAAQTAGASGTPESVRDIIREMTEPQMDWREFLEHSIKASFKDDYAWTSPSRRGMGMDMILPGMTPGDTIDICVSIDTSGSMGQKMLEDLLAEVYGIMCQYSDFKVHIWTFDTKVHNPKIFTPENVEEIKEYKILGGGGTDFMVNYNYMIENEIEPAMYLNFTDGLPWDSWGIPGYCDTIFLVHSDPQRRNKAPEDVGMTLWYEDSNQ